MSKPTTAEIKILGQKIVVRASDNDPEFTAEVVELVSQRVENAEKRLQTTRTPNQVTLLALLDLAEEYVRARRRTADFQTEIESRANELKKLLTPSATT